MHPLHRRLCILSAPKRYGVVIAPHHHTFRTDEMYNLGQLCWHLTTSPPHRPTTSPLHFLSFFSLMLKEERKCNGEVVGRFARSLWDQGYASQRSRRGGVASAMHAVGVVKRVLHLWCTSACPSVHQVHFVLPPLR